MYLQSAFFFFPHFSLLHNVLLERKDLAGLCTLPEPVMGIFKINADIYM